MKQKRDRYEKGSVVEFLDGTRRLIKKSHLSSYDIVPIPDPDNPAKVLEYKHSPYNQDYIIYSSREVKNGMIPSNSIKEIYEVRFKKIGDETVVYNNLGKEIFRQS